MKSRPMPSKKELDQVLKYDPETGKFLWRLRPVTMFAVGETMKRPRSAEHACNQWNSRWAGKPASTLKSDGYCYIHLNYRTELAHRIAWKIMTGLDPVEIDHIDGNRSNNKWSNLRDGTRSDNLRNIALRTDNRSGYHGVHFSKRLQRWVVTIGIGTFDNKEDAIEARRKAEEAMGFHPNHGRDPVEPAKREPSQRTPGVTWETARQKWTAMITTNRKTWFLGRFDQYEDAVLARTLAEQRLANESTDSNPAA